MPFTRKVIIVFACALLSSLLIAGISVFMVRHDLTWLKTCEAGIKEREQCHFSAAEQTLSAAATTAENFPPADERRFTSYLLLAEMYLAVGNFAKADEYLDKARLTADLQNSVQNKLTVMMLTADELFRKAKFEDARHVCMTVLKLAEQNGQTTFQIDALFALTKLDILFLRRVEAGEKVQQIDTLHTKLKQPATTGVALSVYTALEAELKARYKTATLLYEDADRIASYDGNTLSKMKLLIANNSAYFYLLDRNITRAKNVGMRALESCDRDFESYFAGDLLQALRNISAISLAENDLRRAHQFNERELEEVGKRLSHEHPYYGLALEHRAILEAREGKNDASERDFKAAQLIFEKSLGAQNRFSADALAERAKVLLEKNDLNGAADLCKQAIVMYKAILPNDHPSSLHAMMTLVDIYRKQGKPDLANVVYVEANTALGAAHGK